jgi:hypothetical protein
VAGKLGQHNAAASLAAERPDGLAPFNFLRRFRRRLIMNVSRRMLFVAAVCVASLQATMRPGVGMEQGGERSVEPLDATAPPGGSSTGHPIPAYASSNDPAFDVFVNVRHLAHAWARQDSSELTDLALLLAEGERLLMRNRKDITSAHLLEIVACCAAACGDRNSLARLEKVAENRHDQVLQAFIADASKLIPAQANGSKTPSSDEASSRHSTLVHRATQRHILVIRICGDKESLDSLKKSVMDMSDLSAAQKDGLTQLISDNASSIAKSRPDLRATVQLLERIVEHYRIAD